MIKIKKRLQLSDFINKSVFIHKKEFSSGLRYSHDRCDNTFIVENIYGNKFTVELEESSALIEVILTDPRRVEAAWASMQFSLSIDVSNYDSVSEKMDFLLANFGFFHLASLSELYKFKDIHKFEMVTQEDAFRNGIVYMDVTISKKIVAGFIEKYSIHFDNGDKFSFYALAGVPIALESYASHYINRLNIGSCLTKFMIENRLVDYKSISLLTIPHSSCYFNYSNKKLVVNAYFYDRNLSSIFSELIWNKFIKSYKNTFKFISWLYDTEINSLNPDSNFNVVHLQFEVLKNGIKITFVDMLSKIPDSIFLAQLDFFKNNMMHLILKHPSPFLFNILKENNIEYDVLTEDIVLLAQMMDI
jgi:hypothetical protein